MHAFGHSTTRRDVAPASAAPGLAGGPTTANHRRGQEPVRSPGRRRRAVVARGPGVQLAPRPLLGLAKTHLQHVFTAVAMNLVRGMAWLAKQPCAATRIARFTALAAGQEDFTNSIIYSLMSTARCAFNRSQIIIIGPEMYRWKWRRVTRISLAPMACSKWRLQILPVSVRAIPVDNSRRVLMRRRTVVAPYHGQPLSTKSGEAL